MSDAGFAGIARLLLVLVFVFVALAKKAGEQKAKNAKNAKDAKDTRNASSSASHSAERASVPAARAQKRVQMARAEQWRAAKAQQDDAEQVHSIHMDSCESRLESLRVLYDAGILDREEYAQRVARVREKHFKKEA